MSWNVNENDPYFDLPSIEEGSEPVRCGECGNLVFEDEFCMTCSLVDTLPEVGKQFVSIRETNEAA